MISFELLSTNCATAVHLFVCCINKRQNQKVMQNNKEKICGNFSPEIIFSYILKTAVKGRQKMIHKICKKPQNDI